MASKDSKSAKSSLAAAASAGGLPKASKGSPEVGAAAGRRLGGGTEPGRGSRASGGSLNST